MNLCIEDDLDAARDKVRPILALYVGGMGSRDKNFYNQLVQRYGFEENAKEVQDLYLDGKKDEAAAALSPELIDTVVARRAEGPRARPARRRTATPASGRSSSTPLAFTAEDRSRMMRELAEMAA